VTVHYVGRFSDGQRFDSSRDRGQPFTFTVGSGDVVPGWEEGMLGMRAGGKRRIRIPPELGFSAEAAEARVLELEVELLDTEPPLERPRRGCGG
jgi:FKBP-type peptidyl-prolyl cis-trans isomerase